jgi:RNA polymerase sigma-19 factor, ECF subfamily
VEQLVARWAHNPKVAGSSPASATSKGHPQKRMTFFFTYHVSLGDLRDCPLGAYPPAQADAGEVLPPQQSQKANPCSSYVARFFCFQGTFWGQFVENLPSQTCFLLNQNLSSDFQFLIILCSVLNDGSVALQSIMPKPEANKILDKTLFEQLFKAHFVHLCNFAFQYVHDSDSAKDIAQKVFLTLWENREKIDLEKSIKSFLFTSVRNRSLNYIRDQKKYRSRVLDLEIADLEIAFETDDSEVSELQVKVSEVLDTLPEKCRLAFEMSRYQNMKYREIADEIGVSVKTVEAHISKALKIFKDHLKEYVYFLCVMLGFVN